MRFPDQAQRVRLYMSEGTKMALTFIQSPRPSAPAGMTTTEAVREALSLYAFALRNAKGGRKLVTMNPDGSDVVEIM